MLFSGVMAFLKITRHGESAKEYQEGLDLAKPKAEKSMRADHVDFAWSSKLVGLVAVEGAGRSDAECA